MIIELSIILIPYYIVLGIFGLFVIFNIYHMIKFGFLNFEGFFMTIIFIIGILVIAFISSQITAQINWSEPLLIF